MENNKVFDKLIQDNNTTEHYEVLSAYQSALANGNDLIDFHYIIQENIQNIVETLKYGNVKQFTISSDQSSLIDILAELKQYGINMIGMTQVNERVYINMKKEYEKVNALVMNIK